MSVDLFQPIRDLVIERTGAKGPVRLGLPVPEGESSTLRGLVPCIEQGWLTPVLFGHRDKTERALSECGLPTGKCRCIAPSSSRTDPVSTALAAASSGDLDALMLPPELAHFGLVLLRTTGTRFFAGSPICGISVLSFDDYSRLLLLADVVFWPEPSVKRHVEIIRNTVELARKTGIEQPRVALLAAVEAASENMPVTMQAREVAGKFKSGDVLVQGPLSMDLAVSRHAAEKKKAVGDVTGRADVLIGPNLTASRGLYHAAVMMCGARAGVVLSGGKLPVALPGRFEGEEGLELSSLIAALAAIESD